MDWKVVIEKLREHANYHAWRVKEEGDASDIKTDILRAVADALETGLNEER